MSNVADEAKKKLQPVDLTGIGNLLNHLVAKDCTTCDERDRIIKRIAQDNGFTEHTLSILAGYGHSKDEALKRVTLKGLSAPQYHELAEDYVSLTDLAHAHSDDAPGYVIQSWLRNGNTLAFLNLWEIENNSDYHEDGYKELLEKKKAASFTLTPKLWISQTNAIGILSRQGKAGGTFAHPVIACEFASWLKPEFKMMLLNLSLNKEPFL